MLQLVVPEEENQAEQILGLMDAEIAGEPLWPPPSLRILVCVVTYNRPLPVNGSMQATWICESHEAFQKVNYQYDANYRTWINVPMGRVLEQHPSLDISQASPKTMCKPKSNIIARSVLRVTLS